MALSRTPAETADLRYRRTVKKLTRFIKDWLYLIIAAGAVAALIGADASYWNYTYNDSDGYMRALRVLSLIHICKSERQNPRRRQPSARAAGPRTTLAGTRCGR